MASILLIDDNPEFRHEVLLCLEDAGHFVTEASSGDEGFKSFKNSSQDIVITDVVMNHGEGLETMRWIHDLAPGVPVIAISGHQKYLDYMETFGAKLSLLKPFNSAVLINAVDEVIAANTPGLR
jgi:DNA-binding NtrC family response regulator